MTYLTPKPRPTPRVFDRRVEFDPRSRSFPIAETIPRLAKPRSYTWKVPIQLDQGSEGACVGFAVSHEAAARPVEVKGVTNEVARGVYHLAQTLDQWDGENYDGTSVLAGMKAGQQRNWYTEYRWAFGLEDVLLAIGYRGPVVLGLDWFEGMMQTDAAGFLRPTGNVVGGHAILANRVNVREKFVGLHNSWGGDVNGKLTFDDLDMLLHRQGEAAIPVKRRKPE